jgi:putative transposase
MFHRKNIRLTASNYIGRQFYFVTICCFDRRKIFQDPLRGAWLLDAFRSESAARCFAIHAYCLVPDHFHFLAEGLEPSSDLRNFVLSFKLKTSRLYRQRTSQSLWQKKFFDHILRPNEAPESVAWYIWMNPVRKGLAKDTGTYPMAGSLTNSFPLGASAPSTWTPVWKSQPRARRAVS